MNNSFQKIVKLCSLKLVIYSMDTFSQGNRLWSCSWNGLYRYIYYNSNAIDKIAISERQIRIEERNHAIPNEFHKHHSRRDISCIISKYTTDAVLYGGSKQKSRWSDADNWSLLWTSRDTTQVWLVDLSLLLENQHSIRWESWALTW